MARGRAAAHLGHVDDLLIHLQRGLRDRYSIEKEIGRGGMAGVFVARDLKHGRRVAIKVLKPELVPNLGPERFQREIEIAARLTHPNILPLYDSGELAPASPHDPPLLYYVMPYVEGETLRGRLSRNRRIPIADAIHIAAEVADALGFAHSLGLVHRDVKPENIFFQAGHALVSDFGIARAVNSALASSDNQLTASGVVVGTMAYMSPEQAVGVKEVDGRSDLYSLGCVLYEMLTGEPPRGPLMDPSSGRGGGRDIRALRPEVPAAVADLVARTLARDPCNRYQTAAEWNRALTGVAMGGHRPVFRDASQWRRAWIPMSAATAIAIAALTYLVAPRLGADRIAVIKVAVLPFANLTGDASQEYFSDGITEELITELGRINPQRLAIIARTSAMRYKKSSAGVDRIARELGVAYVLEGSARREGTRVRVSAQLVRASDQVELWSDSYDRELSSMLTLQSAVAERVARALAVTLLPDEQRRLTATRTVNAEAYEAYLKGLEYAHRLDRADLETALRYFTVALSHDSNFALAYEGTAQVWSGMQQMGFMPVPEAQPRLKSAASRALALDSTLVRAHYRQAGIKVWSDWDWATGDALFRNAIALNPNDAEGQASYAHFLMIMKRPAEANEHLQRALELDPLSPLVRAFYGTYLNQTRRYDAALAEYRRVLAAVPNMPMALNGSQNALYHLGRYDEWMRMERANWAARNARDIIAALDSGYASGGYRGAMVRFADALAARARVTAVGPVRVAASYLRVGDMDHAMEWLERAYQMHDPNMPYVWTNPGFDAARADPRYQSIHRRMKLPM